MAPMTAAGCRSLLHSQSREPLEIAKGRRRLSRDSWVCLPIVWPVRTAASQISSSGSSCTTTTTTTQKDLSHTLTVDVVSVTGEDKAGLNTQLESGCETPKSKEHRIPDVDIGFCPPAPRKPRAMARRRRVQPTSFFNRADFENFISQHKVPADQILANYASLNLHHFQSQMMRTLFALWKSLPVDTSGVRSCVLGTVLGAVYLGP